MRVRAFASAVFAASLLSSVPAFAQGSDACASAQAIAGNGTFAFDNSAATTDGMAFRSSRAEITRSRSFSVAGAAEAF
jgi:hypothetical protein